MDLEPVQRGKHLVAGCRDGRPEGVTGIGVSLGADSLQQAGAVPLVGEVDQVQVHGECARQVLGAGDVQVIDEWLSRQRIGLKQDQQLGHVCTARLAQDLLVD